ncbi:MAG: CysB family HTH-type transcriptional regulator [Rubrivivax sp.]|jgi:LysR family cys regulon transcriptional activator|nr:CysB family HTH-type transcriptional regulator [Rubrivivax sp.]
MNFQQLRSMREAARRGYNLTEVAEALHTSQPGVSRQIRELEDELGVELFMRAGKRLTGLTPPGAAILPIVERLLHEAENLRRAGADYSAAERGTLTIAATHAQARYALPPAVRDFSAAHPQVMLRLQQGSPKQIARWLLDGEADIGIATEALAEYDGLAALPCYAWTHCAVVPRGHALALAHADGRPLNLAALAAHPIVTYEPAYSGRSHLDEAFRRAQLEPNIVLEAMDADVIKTYVELGMGVGLIAAIAYDEDRDTGLVALDARHLFPTNTTRLAVRRGAWLRGYVFEFIRTFAPPLTRKLVEQAMASERGESFEI